MDCHATSEIGSGRLIEFQKVAGIAFKHAGYLSAALTHSSYARYAKKGGIQDNERLEFFGDAVLKLIVSEYLLKKFPSASEGDLTKIRAQLISDKNLAFLAEKLRMGDFLMMSHGEKNTGGKQRLSNLANAMEAVLGAYYLDSGLPAVHQFFTTLLLRHEQELLAQEYVVDHKTALQEYLQRRKRELPDYKTVREDGPEHDKLFYVVVTVSCDDGRREYEGSGRSKKDAEQMAAKQASIALGLI
jgi:ribonuclease-3